MAPSSDTKKQSSSRGCPFSGSEGYCTEEGRRDWIKVHRLEKVAKTIPISCIADPNPASPVYFWQLHSLMGPDRIRQLVANFYTRIYHDEANPTFRSAFTHAHRLDETEIEDRLKHQISKQSKFWIDVFGGGRTYPIGDFGIKFHHEQQEHIMNAEGSK
jgi:hypothetical protein